MSTKQTDTEYTEERLTEVRDSGDRWEIGAGGSWLSVPKVEGVVPIAGSLARYYGRGFGYPVRGVDIDGCEVYYRIEEEERQRHADWVDEENAKKKAAATAAHDQTARRIAMLPDVIRRRIQKFRDHNSDFDWEFLPYELMVCEDAVKMAVAFADPSDPARGPERLTAFHDLPWEEQKAAVPDLDPGHSGNSFGMACRLARWLLSDPEMVVKDHGALVNLVGCEAYGCPHEATANV